MDQPKWVVVWSAVVGVLGLTAGLLKDQIIPLFGGRVVARAEYVQLAHARLHLDETPVAPPLVLFDDPVHGSLRLAYLASDSCLKRTRTSPSGAVASDFVLDVRPAPPPGLEDLASFDLTLAAPALAGGGMCFACPQHGPPGGERRIRIDDCWERVFWSWPEGCEAVAHWNFCGRYFDANPDGSVRLCWTRCAH